MKGPLHSLVSEDNTAAFVAQAKATGPGCFVEVGVYKGGTAWNLARAAQEQARPCYLYDTFAGIPYRETFDPHAVGDFSDTSIEAIRRAIPYATVTAGVFPESAIEMGPVAFVHLDCDQYRSYADALRYFQPRMISGGVIWCDDADALEGAGRAVREFAAASGMTIHRAEKWYLRF